MIRGSTPPCPKQCTAALCTLFVLAQVEAAFARGNAAEFRPSARGNPAASQLPSAHHERPRQAQAQPGLLRRMSNRVKSAGQSFFHGRKAVEARIHRVLDAPFNWTEHGPARTTFRAAREKFRQRKEKKDLSTIRGVGGAMDQALRDLEQSSADGSSNSQRMASAALDVAERVIRDQAEFLPGGEAARQQARGAYQNAKQLYRDARALERQADKASTSAEKQRIAQGAQQKRQQAEQLHEQARALRDGELAPTRNLERAERALEKIGAKAALNKVDQMLADKMLKLGAKGREGAFEVSEHLLEMLEQRVAKRPTAENQRLLAEAKQKRSKQLRSVRLRWNNARQSFITAVRSGVAEHARQAARLIYKIGPPPTPKEKRWMNRKLVDVHYKEGIAELKQGNWSLSRIIFRFLRHHWKTDSTATLMRIQKLTDLAKQNFEIASRNLKQLSLRHRLHRRVIGLRRMRKVQRTLKRKLAQAKREAEKLEARTNLAALNSPSALKRFLGSATAAAKWIAKAPLRLVEKHHHTEYLQNGQGPIAKQPALMAHLMQEKEIMLGATAEGGVSATGQSSLPTQLQHAVSTHEEATDDDNYAKPAAKVVPLDKFWREQEAKGAKAGKPSKPAAPKENTDEELRYDPAA